MAEKINKRRVAQVSVGIGVLLFFLMIVFLGLRISQIEATFSESDYEDWRLLYSDEEKVIVTSRFTYADDGRNNGWVSIWCGGNYEIRINTSIPVNNATNIKVSWSGKKNDYKEISSFVRGSQHILISNDESIIRRMQEVTSSFVLLLDDHHEIRIETDNILSIINAMKNTCGALS